MRRVLLGLMLIPCAVVGGYAAGRGRRLADAAPLETAASARLARMLQGDFEAQPSGSGEGRVGAIVRKVCRVSAPELGERVLYAEERFASGLGRPFSQRLYVIEGTTRDHARVREYTFPDPGAVRGLCESGEHPALTRVDVEERAGCAVDLSWHRDHFEGVTRGTACRSVLNGADHAKRTLEVRDAQISVRDQGFDAQGAAVWGQNTAPIRYGRRAL